MPTAGLQEKWEWVAWVVFNIAWKVVIRVQQFVADLVAAPPFDPFCARDDRVLVANVTAEPAGFAHSDDAFELPQDTVGVVRRVGSEMRYEKRCVALSQYELAKRGNVGSHGRRLLRARWMRKSLGGSWVFRAERKTVFSKEADC